MELEKMFERLEQKRGLKCKGWFYLHDEILEWICRRKKEENYVAKIKKMFNNYAATISKEKFKGEFD